MDENDMHAMACNADLCKHATVADLVMLARMLRIQVKEQVNMKTKKASIDKTKLHDEIMMKLREVHTMLGQPATQEQDDTAPTLWVRGCLVAFVFSLLRWFHVSAPLLWGRAARPSGCEACVGFPRCALPRGRLKSCLWCFRPVAPAS